jgi:hypothetical protein
LLLAAACGPPKGIPPGTTPEAAAPPALAPRPLSEVYILEASGAQPEDTTVKAAAGERRVVVVRRSAPDYGVFAELEFAGPSLTAALQVAGEVTLTIRPLPSVYGLDLQVEGNVAPGSTITFSYGAHFVAPAGARERYGSNLAFEKALAIARFDVDSMVVFVPTTRPGSDILRAPLAGPGRYIVAAPR